MKSRRNIAMAELFVIRTAGGLYVGEQGLMGTAEMAIHFPNRFAALSKCMELGAVLDHGAILPYRPKAAPAAAGGSQPTPEPRGGLLEAPRAKERGK
jgi:hypothetical protein